MKSKIELNASEEEAEILCQVIAELSEEELVRVNGSGSLSSITAFSNQPLDMAPFAKSAFIELKTSSVEDMNFWIPPMVSSDS